MKLNKIAKIVYLILIIAGVAIGLVIFIQTKLPAEKKSQPPTQVSPQPSPSTTTQVATSTQNQIDTSDWKTYRNDEYGFEIKYPPDCKIAYPRGYIVSITADLRIKDYPSLDIYSPDNNFYRPPSEADLIKWLKDNFFFLLSPNFSSKDIPINPNMEIDGIPAIRISTFRGKTMDTHFIFFKKDNKLFKITLFNPNSEESRSLYNQILFTLRFFEGR
jgi:hypothetical protein